MHFDFWKLRSWEIKDCFKPQKNFTSYTPGFFSGLWYKSSFFSRWRPRKKSRFAGPEIFLRFEADLDFSRPWFSEIKVQIKRPSVALQALNYWCRICVIFFPCPWFPNCGVLQFWEKYSNCILMPLDLCSARSEFFSPILMQIFNFLLQSKYVPSCTLVSV